MLELLCPHRDGRSHAVPQGLDGANAEFHGAVLFRGHVADGSLPDGDFCGARDVVAGHGGGFVVEVDVVAVGSAGATD